MFKREIIIRVETHIRENAFLGIFWGYKKWIIGVAESLEKALNDHRYPAKWKWLKAVSPEAAKAVFDHFMDEGMISSGMEENGLFVYVY